MAQSSHLQQTGVWGRRAPSVKGRSRERTKTPPRPPGPPALRRQARPRSGGAGRRAFYGARDLLCDFEPLRQARSLCLERVDDFDSVEIPFIVGNNDALIRLRDGRDDRFERATWAAPRLAVSHELRPDEGSLLIERKHAAGEQGLWSLGTGKPGL